jgi:hypothetical protein
MMFQPKLEIRRCHTAPEKFKIRYIKMEKPTSEGDRDGRQNEGELEPMM